MERFKRVLSITLASVMLLSLCACGKKEGSSSAGDNKNPEKGETVIEAGKDYIYSFDAIDLGLSEEDNYEIVPRNNYIMARATVYDWPEGSVIEDGEGVITPIPKDGDEPAVEVEEESITTDENDADVDLAKAKKLASSSISTLPAYGEEVADVEMDVDAELPNITAYIKVYDYDMNLLMDYSKELGNSGYISYSDVDSDLNVYMVITDYVDDVTVNTLYKITKDSEVVFEVPLGENYTEGEYWLNNMVVTPDSIICQSERSYDIFSKEDGSLIADSQFGVDEYYGRVMVLRDGKIATIKYGENQELVYLNPKTAKVESVIDIPSDNLWNYDVYAGTAHDFIMTAQDGVYVCNIGDAKITKIMDYISSDMACYGMGNVYEKDENSFYALYYDDDGSYVGLFTKVDPANYVEKQTITLGCFYLNHEVRKDVVKYNKSQDKYKIVVKDYETENTAGDMDIRDILNNEIMAGKQPDILMIPSYVDVSAYEAKGIFEDIGALMDADSTISRDDYLENILKVGSLGDKLYKIIPSFYIYSVSTKASLANEINSWTMKDFNELMAKQKEGTTAFGRISKENFMWYAMNFNMSSFVDWENAEAHFNSDEFINTLKYTDNLKSDEDMVYDDDYWNDYDSMYRNNNALFADFSIYGYVDYARLKQITFGEDISMIGFPSEDGRGSVIGYDNAFYISADSEGKEGAWNFIKIYLSDEKQSSDNIFGLPIKKSALLEKEKMATIGTEVYDNQGNAIPNALDTYWTNEDELIAIKALSNEDAKKVTEFIMSVDKLQSGDSTIQDIVLEEAATYFSGQKKAEDVADVIQNRVQTYIYEKQ